ncbi:MAG: glutathione S-transferase C-terminal domain-containing protein [Rhodoferax sp.]|nr:glutathione S-transferase C-terminal domain-containing protein [Rhodoferax sp.]
MIQLPVAFKGAPGSPYTRKMVALMRYRHIAYRYLLGVAADKANLPKPAVELLPTFYLPDPQGTLIAVTDSTPLIRRLEHEVAGRSALPTDPVLNFLDALLEDFADEWVTKAMFHYRWSYAQGIEKASDILPPHFLGVSADEAVLDAARAQFSKRQIARLEVVGSNAQTSALIEASYVRLVDLLDRHLRAQPFLMGHRPGASDFALYGQLSQLAHFDPTSMDLTLKRSRRVFAWVGLMEDLSGLEPQASDWAVADALAPSLVALLQELAQGYVPVLLMNARVLARGEKRVKVALPGGLWTQSVVPYQAKCLRWLRAQFAAMDARDQSRARQVLHTAGLADLIDADL